MNKQYRSTPPPFNTSSTPPPFNPGSSQGKRKRRGGTALRYILIIFAVLCYLAAFVFQIYTLTQWWIPLTACLAAGALLSAFAWKWLRRATGSESFLPNFLWSTAFWTGVLLAAFYALNFSFADDDSRHVEKGVVTRRYYHNRQRTRRVGRRYVATGETYKVHYIEVEFANGKKKEIEIPSGRVHKFHDGDSLEFELSKGLLGVPVITDRFLDPMLRSKRQK